MPRPKKEPQANKKQPAVSLEARERQLVNLATELAEKQLAEGTASAQVMTHYLKLGTTTAELERQRLEQDVKLKAAQIEQHEAAKRIETLYTEAIAAMRKYQGATDGT